MHIKVPITVEPAHILGKRNSTRVKCGALSVSADTKAVALRDIENSAIAVLRFEPEYRGGSTTGRIYAMVCQGAYATSGGVQMYSWAINILTPSKGRYCVGGGMCFGRATQHEALAELDSYVASCEGNAVQP